MAFVLDKVSEDTFYENCLLGMTKILEKNPRIKNVHIDRQQACSPSEVIIWEQMHCVKFPEDVKDFYLATNGFKLTWSYVFSEQEILPVGLLHINTLSELVSLTGFKTVPIGEIKTYKNKLCLYLGSESKVLYLSQVDEGSKVCLVYTNPRSSPTVWLLDADLNWHYLTDSFRKYMCMGIVHLGMPFWQYCFTTTGVPSWVEQMFIMTLPHLPLSKPVENFLEKKLPDENVDLQNYHINKLDINVFKGKLRMSNKSTDLLKYRKKH